MTKPIIQLRLGRKIQSDFFKRGSAQLSGEAPGLQIRCGALTPSRVGSIPMHFRHFLFKIKYLTTSKHPIFWSETGPEFQIGPEKTLSDSSHITSNHKTSATIFHDPLSDPSFQKTILPSPSDPPAQKKDRPPHPNPGNEKKVRVLNARKAGGRKTAPEPSPFQPLTNSQPEQKVCVAATRWCVSWCTRRSYCNSIILCNHYNLHSLHFIVRLHPVLSDLHCVEIVSLLFQCKICVITGGYTNTHGLSDFLSFLIE